MNTPASIDLKVRHFFRRKGEITGVGTWLHSNGRITPCIALFRTGEERGEFTTPYIMTLGPDLWIWHPDIGDEARRNTQLLQIARALRLGSEGADLRKIRSFIEDHMEDLLTIPPYPPSAAPQRATLAEVTITNKQTGKSHEVVLRHV